MHKAGLILCAAAALAGLAAGCASTDVAGFFLAQSSPGGERVVVGSLETVAHNTQQSLQRLGLAAEMTRTGETVRLTSVTSSGARLICVLVREVSEGTERTRIRLEWEGGRDEQFSLQLLALLEMSGQR